LPFAREVVIFTSPESKNTPMNDNITPQTADRARQPFGASEERYRAFIANSSEGIWRFEMNPPVPIALTADEQVGLIFDTAYLAECNDAAARMYGYERAEEMVGTRLSDFLVRTDPRNIEYLRAFVSSGYRLTDAHSVETDREGRTRHFLNNLMGVIEDGQLVRAWGTQRDVTALTEAEENFKLYVRVLDSMTEGVSVSDEDGIIVYTNPAEDQMFGYERGELIGQHVTVQNSYPPEENERMVAEVIAQLKESGAWTGIWNNRRKDGTSFTTFARITALETSGRRLWVCVQEDVTERLRAEREREQLLELEREARGRAEEALRQRHDVEERLRALVSASESLLGWPRTQAVLSAVLELSRRLVAADAYAIWRLKPETGLWEVVAERGLSDRYRSERIAASAATSPLPESPLVIEDVSAEPLLAARMEMYRHEGICSLLLLPLKAHGEAAGTLVFYYRQPRRFAETDIIVATALANLSASALRTAELYDEQRRLRAEAEAAGRRASYLSGATTALSSSLDYEKTLEAVARLAVPDIADWCAVDILSESDEIKRLAVAHVDPAKVEWANQLQQRYPQDAQSPTGVPAVIRTGRPELYSEVPDEMLVAAARDEEHLRILRDLGIDSVMIVPLSAQGHAFGAITFVLTGSDRRYDETDLSFAMELARRASLAVENARLYRQAREANRLKDEFLATLSHELRTPLTAILGWATLLKTDKLDEQVAMRAVEVIERNARAQKQIIEDVLDVSSIITGKLRFELRPVEVWTLVRDAVESVRPAAEAKGLRLYVALDPEVGLVSADPDRLQQVVWNLLTNAAKFTPEGGSIEVRLRREDRAAVISVKDTGQGIAPDFLPYVFDRFRQADMGTTRKHGGLGLGLAIARHMVELHGGTIRAESAGEGHGATFIVWLPLAEAH
jgi:PAS domain S-box-containing protein